MTGQPLGTDAFNECIDRVLLHLEVNGIIEKWSRCPAVWRFRHNAHASGRESACVAAGLVLGAALTALILETGVATANRSVHKHGFL